MLYPVFNRQGEMGEMGEMDPSRSRIFVHPRIDGGSAFAKALGRSKIPATVMKAMSPFFAAAGRPASHEHLHCNDVAHSGCDGTVLRGKETQGRAPTGRGRRIASIIAAVISLNILAPAVYSQDIPGKTGTPSAAVELRRMQCGKDKSLPKAMFSDTFLYADDSQKDFTFSCYLIRHGDDYLVWDAGLPEADGPHIVDQLKQIGIAPRQIRFLGISHFHFDHIGQAADLPDATLLMGADDLAAIRKGGTLPDGSTDSAKRLAPWISGGKPVVELTGDYDVFADGTVVIMRMPGHTPGHRSLLVRLRRTGNVLISGDLYHFPENRAGHIVPVFNTDRAQSLASMDRFEELARRLKATVIIQHEPADIAKLPKFPNAAR
ncbi:hypothetical protein NRB_07510 [Novosphingobium sp. 11B]